MKKTLSFMVMALALLLTQCRKPEVKFPSPVAPEGTTVSMTVTAGPGSKTDISTMGGIVWSENDKIYVGDGTKYVGYLTLTSGVGTPTGWFSGNVTLPNGTTGENEFGFFYLGSDNGVAPNVGDETVSVSFATQEIYAEDGKLKNASAHHVGYGSAKGTVTDGIVTGINVTLVSKVALARFSFKKGGADYTGELTLSGDKIYNSMTVGFNGSFDHGATPGNITLTAGHGERYVMLVPVGTESETLSFAGDGFAGSTTLGNGIEPNKFYGREVAIEVKPTPTFTVGMDGTTPRTVKFAPGNLWYDGSAFRFESNQWETTPTAVGQTGSSGTWSSSHVSHFLWSPNKDVAVGTSTSVSGTANDVFFTNATWTTANPAFEVSGETAGTWRTLSNGEWSKLLNGRTDANRFAKAKVNGVCGLLIFPDGYNGGEAIGNITGVAALNITNASYPGDNIPEATWSSMESSGVVFLPAAGNRSGTDVSRVGSYGNYWSSDPHGLNDAYYVNYGPSGMLTNEYGNRSRGRSVRLVRSAS